MIIRWILSAIILWLIASFLPGITISGFYAALIVIVILGLVNALIRPILIILTLPVNILTLGLFTIVINGLLFWFVSSIVKGFDVESFTAAVVGSVLLGLSNWVMYTLLDKE